MPFQDYLQLARIAAQIFPYFLDVFLWRPIGALAHKYTYTPTDTPRNVIVVGGSFAGLAVAKRLTETLPSGWRVILIERNSHMNFTFVFPRFSVVSDHEAKAFIPYDTTHVSRGSPDGIFKQVRNSVVDVRKDDVVLATGEHIPYEYLVVATGASQPYPARLKSREKKDGCRELRDMQTKIRKAHSIAIVGGGAVGIEIGSDIKSFYPEKEVTIVHSRDQLLAQYQKRLHDHVLSVVEGLGIRVILKQRPQIQEAEGDQPSKLTFPDGRTEKYDLIIPCTGQSPNSDLLRGLAPKSISQDTNRILVKPTMQITDEGLPNIYALGDVAESAGPHMARAAEMQAGVIVDNLLAAIRGRVPSKVYKPLIMIEGALKLTMGKDDAVIYSMDDKGSDCLLPIHGVPEDFDVARGWKLLGATLTPEKVEAA